MHDPFASEVVNPTVLQVTLQISKLCFPDLIYTGKVVSESDDMDDCEICLFARTLQGEPLIQAAINIEIVKVGDQRSITAEYPEREYLPILWQGQHAVWMDGETGETVGCPSEGIGLEHLARGILKRLEVIEEASSTSP